VFFDPQGGQDLFRAPEAPPGLYEPGHGRVSAEGAAMFTGLQRVRDAPDVDVRIVRRHALVRQSLLQDLGFEK
jgi:hypothetical protein